MLAHVPTGPTKLRRPQTAAESHKRVCIMSPGNFFFVQHEPPHGSDLSPAAIGENGAVKHQIVSSDLGHVMSLYGTKKAATWAAFCVLSCG